MQNIPREDQTEPAPDGAIQIRQLNPLFAAEVSGVDLQRALSPRTVQEVQKAIDRFGVLVFPEQPLNDEQLVGFAGSFGPLQDISGFQKSGVTPGLKSTSRYVTSLSNTDHEGKLLPPDHLNREIAAGNRLWHTDGTYFKVRTTYSFLNAIVIPPVGGETEFCDMRAVYDALPADVSAQLDQMTGEHSWLHSRSLTGFDRARWDDDFEDLLPPPVPRPLIHVHPGSGRRSICLATHIETIQGMSKEESQRLVWELIDFATKPQFVYQHKWQTGDLLMWDNLSLMHRGLDYEDLKYPREMRTIRVLDRMELQSESGA